VSLSGNYRVHVFTSGDDEIYIDEAGELEYLIVGGGGAGGADHGGGGGGGEVLADTAVFSRGVLAVHVGAGGTPGTGRGNFGTNGEASNLGEIIAAGGGRGGQYDNVSGADGASGGGGASYSTGGAGGAAEVDGVTGYAGANGNNSGAGGGGGAGAVGQQSEGGAGVASDITGVSLVYGSGGGGADRSDGAGGAGAGNGNAYTGGKTAGAANRGGGGGGDTSMQPGSAGGSGIVVIRYIFLPTGRRQLQTEDISLQSKPLQNYINTKANIESISGLAEGCIAYATDTDELGTYDGTTWTWGSGGGTWGSITGTLSDQTDLQTAFDGKVDENAAITGATKTKITYDSKGLVTGGADATQDDIGDGTTYKQYSATDKTKLAGIETGADVTDIGNVGSSLHGASAASVADADDFHFWQAVGAVIKSITWSNIKSTLKTYFDTLYQPTDSDLTAIAGLSPSNDDVIQRKSGAWTNRTMAELATDLVTALSSSFLAKDSLGHVNVGEQVAISDDNVYSFTPTLTAGLILIQSRSAATTNYLWAFYVTTAGGSFSPVYFIGSNTVATTGALTGTTGTDGKFTCSVNTANGKIYIENRTGASRNVVIKIW